MTDTLEGIDGFILDLDGTVYRGAQAIEGASEAIAYLRSQQKRIVFLSNRGNISRAMCHQKLQAMGIEASESEILLTSTVTAHYLRAHEPSCRAWILGEAGLKDELEAAGVAIATHPQEATWLVITLHEQVTYAELNDAFRAVRHGARIIATNTDRTFPREDGDCMDVGGLIGAVTGSTGQQVEIAIGKPSQYMSDAALNKLGLPPERCVVIGDSLVSDIGLGKRAGMRTALVLSGSTTIEDVREAVDQPDWIWESLTGLTRLMQQQEGIL